MAKFMNPEEFDDDPYDFSFVSEKINAVSISSKIHNGYIKGTNKPSLIENYRKGRSLLSTKDIQDLIQLRQKNLPNLIKRAKKKLPLFD